MGAVKCKACQAFYHYFCNKFNKFTNTVACILDSILSYDIKITL